MIRIGLSILWVILMTSCSQANVQDYSGLEPKLDLKQFFDGKLMAYGMLQNRSGKVTRRFRAEIDASWQGNTGTLDEVFYFDDGEVDTRVWTLIDEGNGKISGTAGDVVGTAEGQSSGFALNWVYTLEIPYNDSTINVRLDDWLYLITRDRLINRTTLKKFGFEVGQLTLVIERVAALPKSA